VRTCLQAALAARAACPEAHGAEAWIGELIWREFYVQILGNFPHVAVGPFLAAAQRVPWLDDEAGFSAWCEGRTGFPIVDAAMKQLTSTGWMHNRLRMISASFLTKDLLIDWRRGERFFEQWLADADLAANNGGWQWAASTGTDAAPYFRIFNPALQSKKFDPEGAFIAELLPELAALPAAYRHEPASAPPLVLAEAGVRIGETYPAPIVDHPAARLRALAAFSPLLGSKALLAESVRLTN
jgi:deoxyribodipyrimidine photo-lyase